MNRPSGSLRSTAGAVAIVLTAAAGVGIGASAQSTRQPSDRAAGSPGEWDVRQARGSVREIDFTTDEGTWMTVSPTPDGRTIVFDLLGEIYALPAAGGEATLLTRDSGVAVNFQPAVSPDGARIAFVSDRQGQNNLWIMNADGSNPRVVDHNLKVRHALPAWTPDGRFVAARRVSLAEDDRGGSEIWLYHVDGGKGVQLTRAADHPRATEPFVSRDGRFLFFTVEASDVEDPAKGRTQLRRLDLQTGHTLRLTEGAERGGGGDSRLSSGGGFTPRPSPDGRWLAFGRRLASGTFAFKGHELGPRTALWLRNLESGAERLLVDPLDRDLQERVSDWSGFLPGYAWSADGTSIYLGQGGKIRRVDVATGTVDTVPFSAAVRRRISEQAYTPFRLQPEKPLDVRFLRWPAVSPDGRRLAFQAVGRIWLTDVPPGTPRPLLPATFAPHQYAPAWSPDGRTIAFTSWTDDERGHLWTMNADGGEPTQLTAEAGEYLNPVWTPDGSGVVVVRGSGATLRGQMLAENNWYELWHVPAARGTPRLITAVSPPTGRVAHRRLVVQPSFGPEGRLFYPEIIPTTGNEVRTELRSIRLDGLDRRTHAALPAADEAVVSPDGRWVAFEEGDNVYLTPLLWPGIGARPLDIKREEKPSLPITPVSTEGGNYPRWSSETTLVFGSARQVFVHDTRTGRTASHAVALQVPRDAAAGTVALRNARVITINGTEVIESGDVLVTDGRIAAVGRSGTVRVPAGARVFDLRSKTIMPGLVDLHTHNHRSPSGILPQRDYEMAAVFAYGVTTSLDNSMFSQNIFPQAELAETGELVGPRTFSTGDPLYQGDHARQNELESLEQTLQEVRRLKSYGAVSLKQYMQPERRQRQWVSEAARREGLMVTAEGGDMLYVLTMIMDGQTGWEHPLPQVPVYADLATFLGRANAFYSPTFVVAGAGPWNDQFFTQESDLWADAKLRRFAPWRKLEAHTRRRDLRPRTDYTFPLLAQGLADVIAAGGHGAIGAHGQQHGLASHWEVWMLASAMPPIEALRIATLDGATMIGVHEDVGSITTGKLADLVVLNGNPLQDIRQTANIAYVMKGGRLFNGDTLDEIWPRTRPYGRFFWEMDEARPTDVKTVR